MSEQEWLDIFGDNLVDILKDANMTQKDLAEETGLSEASISAYIHKRKIPGIKALINISCVIGCTLDDLMFFGDTIK